MKRILITGANGFIGKNLVATLQRLEGIEILKFGTENTLDQLKEFANKADFVFHLAGINRPLEVSQFDTGNRGFTEQLLRILKLTGRKVPVLISSSIQAALDNPYGLSKKGAEEAVFNYEKETGAKVYVYRLPNVFGKWCRPNYNSVIATWCYNLSRDLPITINNPEAELNLVYVDDVVEEFIHAMQGKENRGEDHFCYVRRTFRIKLGHLAELLYSFKESRKSLVMSNLEGDLERFLYSTYLSYLPEDKFGYPLDMKRDPRGWLAEVIKSKSFGQIFISRTKPGITRGNHWHHTKVEKFLVIEGEAVIKFRPINGTEVIEYKVSGEQLTIVDIPPGYTHSITNIGESDLITLFWANETFNPEKPDTYYLEV